MIISVDAEKALNKIQNPFVIKTLNKLKTKRNFLTKGIYEKATPNIIINGVY